MAELEIGVSDNAFFLDVNRLSVRSSGIQSSNVTVVNVPMVEELEKVVRGLEPDSLGNPINIKQRIFICKEGRFRINGGKNL